MQITIDTNNLSELDIAMLAFLADQGEEAEEAPAPAAKKAAPVKKAAAPKAEAASKEPDPDPEIEEDIVGDDAPPQGAPTMSDAVAAATQLVSAGESAKVKAALAAVGAKRVSEMSEDDIPTFLASLDG